MLTPPTNYVNPKQRRFDVQALYEKGWSLGRIIRTIQTSIPEIRRWAAKYGWTQPIVAPSRTRYTPEERSAVVSAVQEGDASIAEISRQTEIHRRTIGRWVRSIAPEDVIPAHWRCYCTEYGTPVTGPTCHLCGRGR